MRLFHRENARVLTVAALGVILVGQFALSRIPATEPYPVILMPGFGSAPSSSGSFEFVVRSAEIRYSDAKPVTVTPEQLFDGLEDNQVNPSWDRLFRLAKDLPHDQQAMRWVHERVTDLSVNVESAPVELRMCRTETRLDIHSGAIADAPCSTEVIAL